MGGRVNSSDKSGITTPRTDAQVSVHDEASPLVERTAGYNDLLEHARQLERELAEARLSSALHENAASQLADMAMDSAPSAGGISLEAETLAAWLKSWWHLDDDRRAARRIEFGLDFAHLMRGVANMIEGSSASGGAGEVDIPMIEAACESLLSSSGVDISGDAMREALQDALRASRSAIGDGS